MCSRRSLVDDAVRSRPVRRRGPLHEAFRPARFARRGSGRAAGAHLLPLDRAERSSPRSSNASGRRALESHEQAPVRVVVEKPFGTSARRGSCPEPHRAPLLRRVADLPHRPLPGQGDRPEHDGAALRQRALRAAVEPQLHRLGPDHRRGGHRHRLARRLLRPHGRAARSDPEPHAAAAVPHRDGASRRVQRRRGAQREAEGAALDPRAAASGK